MTRHEAITATKNCTCGKLMILSVDDVAYMHNRYASTWRCFACNLCMRGDDVSDNTKEQLELVRWKRINGEPL